MLASWRALVSYWLPTVTLLELPADLETVLLGKDDVEHVQLGPVSHGPVSHFSPTRAYGKCALDHHQRSAS